MPLTSLCAFPQVYVLKRPYVDEFLRRMGELFECVLFTASLAKVPGAGGEKTTGSSVGATGVVQQPLAGPQIATGEPGPHPNKSVFSFLSMLTL